MASIETEPFRLIATQLLAMLTETARAQNCHAIAFRLDSDRWSVELMTKSFGLTVEFGGSTARTLRADGSLATTLLSSTRSVGDGT